MPSKSSPLSVSSSTSPITALRREENIKVLTIPTKDLNKTKYKSRSERCNNKRQVFDTEYREEKLGL